MNRSWIVLLVACIVIAYEMNTASAQFSFSLPGKWGNGKRGGPFSFSLPGKWGSGKRSAPWSGGECGKVDPEVLLNIYSLIQEEALRINDCTNKAENEVNKVAH